MLGSVLGGLGGAVGGIIGLATAGDGGEDELKRAVEVLEKIRDPAFNFAQLTAPELRLVGEYFPQVYEAIVPQEVALPEDSPEGRQAQLSTLRHLGRVAEEGLPLAERIAASRAQNAMAEEYGRGQQAIIQDMAMRGRTGGGDEIAARMAMDQGAANLARDQGESLAMQAVMNRLNAARDVGSLGGALRAQDIGLSSARANAVNRFNEYVSGMLTNRNIYGAEAANQAQAMNLGENQRIADQNALNQYLTQLANINRENELRQQLFNSQLGRGQAVAGALTNLGNARYAEEAARQQTYQNIGQGIGQAGGGLLGGIL